MPITVKVNGTNLSLVHKGSDGFVKNTLPDVCKSPTVPVPYTIFSFSSDLANGARTVTADGGNMTANFGSEFSTCVGDEPGVGGGVVSGTNLKEAKWLTFSFDVKLEGKGACRLTDKMTMNHANTVSMGGEEQKPISGDDLKKKLLLCPEAKKVYDDAKKANGGKDPKVVTGKPSAGFQGQVDLTTGQVSVLNTDHECVQLHTLALELARLARKQEQLDANAQVKKVSRDDFIKLKEKFGYDRMRETEVIYQACKKTWGCEKVKSDSEWVMKAKDFDDYFKNHLSPRHKEHYGKFWDAANKKP